jgi:hypothetical protein
MHNLSIMRLESFRGLLERFPVETLFVGFIGTLTLNGIFPFYLPDFAAAMDKFLWLLLHHQAIPTSMCSPYLMFVGRATRFQHFDSFPASS